MNSHASQTECPRAELAAYIDGELALRMEIELEAHLAECKLCAAELNEQKRLLCALDFALDGDGREFKLPENFTRVVVANAESRVSGLRSAKERSNAIFVISALFLMFLLGVGGEIKTVARTFLQFGEQIFAVGGFTTHLLFDVAVGASVILRSVGSQVFYGSSVSAALLIIFFLTSLFALSRLVNGSNQS